MAKPFKACDADLKKARYPIIVMPKIDGVRGLHMNGQFTTRNLKPFRNDRLSVFNHPSFVGLDGELAAGAITDPDLCRLTTSFTSSFADRTSDIALPTWWVFDKSDEPTMPYRHRIDMLHDISETLRSIHSNIRVVPYEIANSEEEVLALHSSYIEQGFEGTVLRSLTGKYKHGRCTANEGDYLRIKDLGDEEAIILELVEAQTNNNPSETNELGYQSRSSHKENKAGNGMIGALIVRIPDGRIETIGAGNMPHSERIYYWNNPDKIISKTCTYKFMVHGEKDSRRHARYKNLRDGDI